MRPSLSDASQNAGSVPASFVALARASAARLRVVPSSLPVGLSPQLSMTLSMASGDGTFSNELMVIWKVSALKELFRAKIQ